MKYIEKRFKLFGIPVIFRKRKYKVRAYEYVTSDSTFNAVHMGKVSLYWGKIKPTRKVGGTW